MKVRVLALGGVVVLLGCALAAAPADGKRQGRWSLVAEALKRYKARDAKGHEELMKLRTTDREAFRARVGKLVREAVAKDPELKKLSRRTGRGAAKFDVPETVRVVRDIVYARYGERKVLLDLFLPKADPAGKRPCIMVVHGGGWRSGNKERFARFAAAFAEQGFAAACIGYRLRPEVEVRQCVEDAKASVRWVRANAAKHHIDTDRLGAFGGSAGAHLAAMLGTSFKVKKLEGEGGHADQSSRVHAVVALATPADLSAFGRVSGDKEAARLISSATHVDADSAQFLLMHAKGDRVVPYKQSLLLAEKLKAAKVPVRLITLDSGSHAFWNGSGPAARQALADAIAFFRKALKHGADAKAER